MPTRNRGTGAGERYRKDKGEGTGGRKLKAVGVGGGESRNAVASRAPIRFRADKKLSMPPIPGQCWSMLVN